MLHSCCRPPSRLQPRATTYNGVSSTRTPDFAASRQRERVYRYPPPRVHRFQTNRPCLAFVPSPTERSPSSPHPAWGYPVENRIWFFPRISPCSGPWWLSPRGVGTGEGASPAPDKMSPKTLMRPRSATGSTDENPRRVITAGTSRLEARQPGLRFRFRWDFHVKVPLRPPTPPALRAHPPPPPGGEGSHGDTRWKAVPGGGTGGGFPGEEGSASPDPAPPRALPVQWTVAAIAPGGGGRGGGTSLTPAGTQATAIPACLHERLRHRTPRESSGVGTGTAGSVAAEGAPASRGNDPGEPFLKSFEGFRIFI